MIETLAALSSALYMSITLTVFFSIKKRSSFWIFFLATEYFYFLGVGVFPFLLALGLQGPPTYAHEYSLEKISSITFLHIAAYSLGAALGFYSKRAPALSSEKLLKYSLKLKINPLRAFHLLTAISITSLIAYILIVGLEPAINGASAARGGNFDAFDDGSQYRFLTRFMLLGLYAVAFFPFIAASGKNIKSSSAIMFLIGISCYITLVSRYAILQAVLIPILIIWHYNKSKSLFPNLMLALSLVLAIFIYQYGKSFVGSLSLYLFHGAEFSIHQSIESNILDSFSHLLYSIDSGIKNFFETGPTLTKDIILSSLGIIPSSIYSSIGIPELSYQLLPSEARFACINTLLVSNQSGCFIPPYFIGASAYLTPIAGAFIFGYTRFLIYSTTSKCYHALTGNEKHLPPVIVIFLCAEQLMLFIPNTISLTIFFLIICSIALHSRALKEKEAK